MDVSVFLRKTKKNRRTGNKQKKKNTLDSQQQIVFVVYVSFCAYVWSDIFVYLKVFKSKNYH